MQCNAREDDDKKVYEILTPSFQKSTALLISLEEILECWCCWWQSGEEWWRGDVNVQRLKAKKAWFEHPKDFSMLNLTGNQATCLTNHQ